MKNGRFHKFSFLSHLSPNWSHSKGLPRNLLSYQILKDTFAACPLSRWQFQGRGLQGGQGDETVDQDSGSQRNSLTLSLLTWIYYSSIIKKKKILIFFLLQYCEPLHYELYGNYSFKTIRPLLMSSTVCCARAYVVVLAFSGWAWFPIILQIVAKT